MPLDTFGQCAKRFDKLECQLLAPELGHQRVFVFDEDQFALGDDADAIGHFLGFGDVMRGEDDGDAGLAQTPDERPHVTPQLDIDTGGGDAQVVNGNGNQTFGDIDVDADGATGPQNFVFGNGNDANALQDNSVNIDDSFNTDNSVEDSGNVSVDDSFNTLVEDNDTTELSIDDSFNTVTEDNDVTTFDFEESFEDNSIFEDNDTFDLQADLDVTEVDLDDADHNDLDLDL